MRLSIIDMDIFALSLWQIWLIASVAMFILEIVSTGFVLACFGVGALVAMLVALLGLSLSWQVGAFALGTLYAFFRLRSFMERRFRTPNAPTGVDALIGRRVRLRESVSVDQDYFELPIDGDVWRARLMEPTALVAGYEVEVVSIDGIILVVKPI